MITTQDHEQYMRLALAQAEKAISIGEVPVGCVIVKDGEVIGQGYNTRETAKTPLGHAELTAIAEASAALNGWRLSGCFLYVTLEPCPMCMGAIINSRIDTVVYGARDAKAGCCGSVIQLADCGFNHRPKITGEILSTESQDLLSHFFQKLRGR